MMDYKDNYDLKQDFKISKSLKQTERLSMKIRKKNTQILAGNPYNTQLAIANSKQGFALPKIRSQSIRTKDEIDKGDTYIQLKALKHSDTKNFSSERVSISHYLKQ